jgi:hypothetical protein
VVLDSAGNLYGTTTAVPGVSTQAPYGVVWELNTGGQLIILKRFPRPSQTGTGLGSTVNPGVVLDSAGNIYGVRPYEGFGGMIFRLNTAGEESKLYSFPPAPGGSRGLTRPATSMAPAAAGRHPQA